MTIAKAPLFDSWSAYLAADPSVLPEGRFEYWDGALRPVMSESGFNDDVANYLYFLFVNAGIWPKRIKPHSCELEVPGTPRTRFPDLTILDESHVSLLERRNTITRNMRPPTLLVEVVSPGSETSENYRRDYQDKAQQYAAIGVLEYWLVDPDRAVVLVGQLVDGVYRYDRFQGEQRIVSPTFPQLSFTAAMVLSAGESA